MESLPVAFNWTARESDKRPISRSDINCSTTWISRRDVIRNDTLISIGDSKASSIGDINVDSVEKKIAGEAWSEREKWFY